MKPTSLPNDSSRRTWNPLTLAWLASAWIALPANWPLWAALNALPEMATPRGRLFMAALCGIVLAATAWLLTLAAWRLTIKPVIALFLLAAAAGAYFMGTYNVVIDADMITNVLQTDLRETRDLLSLRFALTMIVLGVLPLALLWRVPVRSAPGWGQVKRNLLGLVSALVLIAVLLASFFADMSATMRNHHTMRYRINPLNSFYGLAMSVADAQQGPSGPPLEVGTDAQPNRKQLPTLLILVVGETARADHFSLNGYARTTNPRLKEAGVLSFGNVSSCGTSTATSLPCMFSVFGKESFESEKQPRENLLDVLQRAGMAVLWLDNQAGCKGVCDRVPNAQASDAPPQGSAAGAPLCDGSECLDEALLHGLDERLKALPETKRQNGTVLVLHQMGSHGPAYWKRSPPDRKPFKPECETNVLQQCDRQALINAYDNSIAYTDKVLGQLIEWLQKRSAEHPVSGLLYLSDHGESLGENNLYLHGLPYAFAPREQKHVPMVLWLSSALAYRTPGDCVASRTENEFSHDNLSHTVLGLMGVQTSVYQPGLDVLGPCRRP